MNYCVKHAVEKLEVNNVTNCQPFSDRVTLHCETDTYLPKDSWYIKSYYFSCRRLPRYSRWYVGATDDVTQRGCDKRSGPKYGRRYLGWCLPSDRHIYCVTAALCGVLEWCFWA